MDPSISEVIQSDAKVITPPPATGYKAVIKHFRDWLEAYFWLPLSLFSIYGAAKFAYLLTGRAPTEGADWIVEFAQRAVVVVLVIFFVSVSREQTGFWLSKEESLAHPYHATLQLVSKMFMMGLFTYIFLH
jgi:hypothetical protein